MESGVVPADSLRCSALLPPDEYELPSRYRKLDETDAVESSEPSEEERGEEEEAQAKL